MKSISDIGVFNNESGSSLLLVLLALSFVAALSISLFKMTDSGLKNTKILTQDRELARLRSELVVTLSNASLCKNSFQKNSGAGLFTGSVGTPTDPSDPDDHVSVIARNLNGNLVSLVKESGLVGSATKVSNIYLTYQKDAAGVDLPPQSEVPAGHTTHSVELHLTAKRSNGTVARMSPIKTSIYTSNINNEIIGCMADASAADTNINFLWSTFDSNNPINDCPTGFIDTGIRDEADHKWNLNKGKDDTTKDQHMLCIGGVEDISWTPATCPDGFVDTGIQDDDDDGHRLYEQEDPPYSNLSHFCIKGIAEAIWRPDCEAGWAASKLWDNDDDPDHIFDKHKVNFHSLYQLCVR